MFLKTTAKLFLLSTLVIGASVSAQAGTAQKFDCGQAFRQISITAAHAVAAMICNLQSNNLTEKLSRVEANSLNFINKWSVEATASEFIIDGTCSTALRYYNPVAKIPSIIHPGYKLSLVIPRSEPLCGPEFHGSLTEIYEPKAKIDNSLTNQAQDAFMNFIVQKKARAVVVKFKDTGFLDSSTNEFKGGRSLTHISLSGGLLSILQSKYSNASLSEGQQTSAANLFAIGEGVLAMTQSDFFYGDFSSHASTVPNFSLIKAGFQFNKSIDPAYANRDQLTISGFGRDLYIRQTGVTQIEETRLAYAYEGGTSAFYVRNYDMATGNSDVVGCTDYSYSGDYNTVGAMDVTDCRRVLSHLPNY